MSDSHCPKDATIRSAADVERDQLVVRLAYAVVGVSRRWILRTDEVLAESGLNGSEIALLLLLDKHAKGMTQKELSVALALSEPVLSKRTGNLLKKGMIERSDLIGDRRANLVRLTTAGAEALNVWGGCLACLRQRTTAGISMAELSQTLHTLARLDRNLRLDECNSGTRLGDHTDAD